MIELLFWKSVSELYLEYHIHDHYNKSSESNDYDHREVAGYVLHTQLSSARHLFLRVQHCLKSNYVAIHLGAHRLPYQTLG